MERIIKHGEALSRTKEDMFCYQCQETANNKGCTKVGVCGKSATVANKQDMLMWITKGLS